MSGKDIAILGRVRIGSTPEPVQDVGGIEFEGTEGIDYWFVPCITDGERASSEASR